MNEPNPRWQIHLLMVLGLLLVEIFFLFLLAQSGALTSQQIPSPPANAPATSVWVPRATIPGLMEGSGPTANPQEGQEGAPSPAR